MLPLSDPALAFTVTFIVSCIYVDFRTRRIPNVLTAPAMVVGIGLNAYRFGLPGVETSIAGLVVAVALLIFPFAMGGIGAGDVKMMGAIGAMLGPQLAVRSLVAGMILGGIVMLAHLARVGRLREKLGATIRMVWAAVVTRSLTPLRKPAEVPDALALPYSVPLGLGTLLAFWLLTLRP